MKISLLTCKGSFFLCMAFLLLGISACKKADTASTSNNEFKISVTDLNNPTDGSILLAPITNSVITGYLYILDKNGNGLVTKKINSYAMNFRKWNINGATRYTYTEYNPNGYHIKNILYASGDDVVLDENLNEIKRYNFLPGNNRSPAQNLEDSHDFILLGDDHYISMTYYEKNVTNIPPSLNPARTVKVAAPIIQEVSNGQIVWEWDATKLNQPTYRAFKY